MPDQSGAAKEHAITQDLTALPPTQVRGQVAPVLEAEFPVVRRGYERDAVDAYVMRTRQLVAELQATRTPDSAVRRALERVGEEVSGILARAHETAEEITVQSRIEADERLQRAMREAQEITAAAKAQLRDLDADADRIWAERQRIIDDARALAEDMLSLADTAAERFAPVEGDEPEEGEGAFGDGTEEEAEAEEETSNGLGLGSIELDEEPRVRVIRPGSGESESGEGQDRAGA